MRSMVKLMVSGVVALMLAACSGGPSTGGQQTGVVAASSQAQGQTQDGPNRFLQHFDKNGDGKVQLTELPEHMQQRLTAADTNKDGVLSPEEMHAFRSQMQAAKFAKADKNGDGALDATEVSAERWARIQVADANKDGKVTKAELEQARATGLLPKGHHHKRHHGGHEGQGQQGERQHDPQAMIQRFDKNGDGALQASEVPERMKGWFDKVDANKDGTVTKEEIQQFRATHQHDQHVRTGGTSL